MNTRVLAYRILRKFEKDGRFPTEEVRDALSRLKDRERAFLKELVWGVLRRQVYIDWVIDSFLKNPEIPPSIRIALRMGVYQILFMDSVPDYAAVNESVKLVEQRSFRKLVNAVLRRVARKEFGEPNELHVKYSHPKWISEYLVEHYGMDVAKKIMESHLSPSPLVLRVNTLRFTREDVLLMLEEDGVSARKTSHSPAGVVVRWKGDPMSISVVKGGGATIQGESSQLAAYLLDPKPGWKVIDVAAGFGGKTTHLAELMKNQGKVVALDVSFEKIEALVDRARTMGIDIVETAVMDARNAPAVFPSEFDAVLVDVPCTAVGTARKNPDVLLALKKKKLDELTKLQKEILQASWKLLKPGGKLLYVTCSFFKEENEGALEVLEGGKVVDIRGRLDDFDVDYVWDGKGALVLPDDTLSEMYFSLIEKG